MEAEQVQVQVHYIQLEVMEVPVVEVMLMVIHLLHQIWLQDQEILPQQLQPKEQMVELAFIIVQMELAEVVAAVERLLLELLQHPQEIQVEMELQLLFLLLQQLTLEEAVEVIVHQDNQQVEQAVEEVEVLLVQQLHLGKTILVVEAVEVMVVQGVVQELVEEVAQA